jgi:hypothetical protein
MNVSNITILSVSDKKLEQEKHLLPVQKGKAADGSCTLPAQAAGPTFSQFKEKFNIVKQVN